MLRNRINDYFVYTLHSALNDAKILRSLKIPVGIPVFSRRAYRPSCIRASSHDSQPWVIAFAHVRRQATWLTRGLAPTQPRTLMTCLIYRV